MFFFTVAAISATEPEISSRLFGFGHGVRALFLSA
jgi:hypothetical protein